MPLPPPTAPRDHAHTRSIRFECYRRADGHFDVEGRLLDTKPFAVELSSGLVPANAPMHDMWLRLTIDASLNVLDAEAATDAMPYPGACSEITPDYARQLVGLNLGRGFRRAVQERFANVKGCTHLTELLLQCPTAAIQTLAGFKRDNEDRHGKPFQLDRCHALDTHGEAVRRYYPKWYVGEKAKAKG
jgi:hypothetical protein